MTRPKPKATASPTYIATALLTLLSLFVQPSTTHAASSFPCTDIVPWEDATSSGNSSAALQFDDPTAPSSTVVLTKTTAPGQLCTLFVIEENLEEVLGVQYRKRFYLPVGRSYDGHNWERVAGRFTNLSYDCTAGATCTVTLPDTDTKNYYMAAYKHTLDELQATVRFLEKATFGIRSQDLDSLATSTSSAERVQSLNEKVPTSHRRYFRHRLNPRSLEIYKYGLSGPHACDAGSTWRSFAFTRKDKIMSVGPTKSDWPMTMHNVTLEKRELSSCPSTSCIQWIWLYAGHVRTMMDAQPAKSSGSLIAEGTYKVCGVDEFPGQGNTAWAQEDKEIYARFQIVEADGSKTCRSAFHVSGGNPIVFINEAFLGASNPNNPVIGGDNEAEPYVLVSPVPFSNFERMGYDPTRDGGVGHQAEKEKANTVIRLPNNAANFRLHETTKTACISVPDPEKADGRSKGWIYSPYYEGRDHPNWDPSSRSTLDAPVFIKFDEGYYIHDRRYLAKQNTIKEPYADGGGNMTIHSVFRDIQTHTINEDGEVVELSGEKVALMAADFDENPRTRSSLSGDEQAIYCMNDSPNIFNEAGCKLATEKNACVREDGGDEDTVTVVTLTKKSMHAIKGHICPTNECADLSLDLLAKGVPAVVRVGEPSTESKDLPCTMGSVSRFYKNDLPEDACKAASQLGPNTALAFQHLLKYSVTNNDILVNVRMYEAFKDMKCDGTNAETTGFKIWVEHTTSCYSHIHAHDLNVYLIKNHNLIGKITSGELVWNTTDMGNFADFRSTNIAWGSAGGKLTVLAIIGLLDVYGEAGGLDVTLAPTTAPSIAPSGIPSVSLSPTTSTMPSVRSNMPSTSSQPSMVPSVTNMPSTSSQPSSRPSSQPSLVPSESFAPSNVPSTSSVPSASMSLTPSTSTMPSVSSMPSTSSQPSMFPSESNMPSTSSQPSAVPSRSNMPSTSSQPSSQPSTQPSLVPSESFAPSNVPSTSSVPSASMSLTPSISTMPSTSLPSSMPSTSLPSSMPSISLQPSTSAEPSSQPSSEPSQISQIARTKSHGVFEGMANDPDVAQVILKTQLTKKSGGVLVCGSEGEIKADPLEDDYFDYWNWRLDSSNPESEQKKTVWTNIALTKEDQLCQRTAFALSQIFSISPDFLGYNSLSEAYTTFYDGFVLNCHSTYKQVFKTIAFSVKMGMQLSHAGSASVRTSYDAGGQIRFPDENFAREAMQLETVGLDMLQMDGTPIKDKLGFTIPTYDTHDILTFARAWTGMKQSKRRGNYEEKGPNKSNWNDPMTLLDANSHDWFPKLNLLDGWIGDRYPLCYDLAAKAFLKKGATYKLLGRSSSPRYQFDRAGSDKDETVKKMILSSTSNLLQKLCENDGERCTYPSVVKLTGLDLDCVGLECQVDTVRVVQVAPNVFYEYVRLPCVHHAFIAPESSKKVIAGHSSMCAHKTQPVGTETCCNDNVSKIRCTYHGEYVKYDTNSDRCNAVCPAATTRVDNADNCPGQTGYNRRSPKNNHFAWTSGDCKVKVKVRMDGMVALVHEPEESDPDRVVKYVKLDTENLNFFHVPWPEDIYIGDQLFPIKSDDYDDNAGNDCGESTCAAQDDDTCLCDVTVKNDKAFSKDPPTIASIYSKLKIGAFPPATKGIPILDGSVHVYHKENQGYTEHTIFRLPDETDEFIGFGEDYHGASNSAGWVYLKNLDSTIVIGNMTNPYYSESTGRRRLEMRNPLMFHDLVAPEIRDAHYEIDAVIHHLTSHPNAAPFISLQLIQHFGIANPSPGYIKRVAEVYKAGSFESSSITFGDGKFSNLDAVVAAILLDKESLSNTLDADPAAGGLKEPILKVLQFMRANGYVQTSHDRNIYPKLSNMGAKIGQMPHESPDQFNFFLSDYSPPGAFATSGLVAPPAQVLTLSTTVATMEGFFSLVRNGLSSQGEGFGPSTLGRETRSAGDYKKSVGYLSYESTLSSSTNNDGDIVKKLADILTAGRLSVDAKAKIVSAISAASTMVEKVRLSQQLIGSSPEFHTTNLAVRSGNDRTPTPTRPRQEVPYKAIVILMASGGMDSYNVLAPHTSCALFKSYRQNREVLALADTEMLPIQNDNPDHDCTVFGVHKGIPVLKTIYDATHGQFHAGIGHLAKPVTKSNWYTETKTHLFSHTTMFREAQLVDAFQEGGWSTGVAGRMLDVLQRRGLSVNAIGIGSKGPIIEGDPTLGRKVDVISSNGVNTLSRGSLSPDNMANDLDSILPFMKYLNQETALERSGVFADYWSQNLVDVLNKTDALSDMLRGVTLNRPEGFTSNLGRKLGVVAKMIRLNEDRKVNRDIFFIKSGGHDGHSLSKENLARLLPGINRGIEGFYNEMVSANLLDAVTFVFLSEFGRTITPNSGRGSDHAWSGNAFVWGGQIRGRKILGQYVKTFDKTDVSNIGRGRLIPKRSWESMWYGIANWYGIIDDKELETVLPNNGNMGCELYTDKDMYTVGNNTISGCNDRTVTMKLSMFLNSPRYLTGIEQKKICRAAMGLTSQKANVTSRCVVTDQEVTVHFDADNSRRVLSNGDMIGRTLETQPVLNSTNSSWSGKILFSYANPAGSTNGTDYVENGDLFAENMNTVLIGNCTSSVSGRRLDGVDCINSLPNCAGVTEMEAQVTDSPSLSPSITSHPSLMPSSEPSPKHSSMPSSSSMPSENPSTSAQPSSMPSENPSTSVQPSSMPSSGPSLMPSENPSTSAQPSSMPSENPSTSVQPSSMPSENPSTQPSAQPSSAPSHFPSGIPSQSPTDYHSENPSGIPNRQCPIVIDKCYRGGMWSPYTCECLCLSPRCPDENSGLCTKTICLANYHETLFDDQPFLPWFQFQGSCASSKEVPATANAIYRDKEDCCASEYQDNIRGCVQRPAGLSQLTYNGQIQLVGYDCLNSGSERSAAGADIASSFLKIICSKGGFTCDESEAVVVSNFCGDVDSKIKVEHSSSRRLQSSNTAPLQVAFVAQSLFHEEVAGIEALLSTYLQGASLTKFLDDVLADILANSPTASLTTVTSITYNALNAFIAGLGLHYPAWGRLETCISDGNQENYMNGNANPRWLYETLESCCKRYYDWDQAGCKSRNAEATLVSGSLSSIVNPVDTLYFPDWEGTDTCINDGTAPPYMKTEYTTWMYSDLSGCCRAYYGWEGGFAKCMISQGGKTPTRSPHGKSYYVNWNDFLCVESCEGASPCGGEHKEWDIVYSSKIECCQTRLWWKVDCMSST